jgi:hypothetical protein
MTDYEKTVKVLEGPWSDRGNDYMDTSTNKRVMKLND